MYIPDLKKVAIYNKNVKAEVQWFGEKDSEINCRINEERVGCWSV